MATNESKLPSNKWLKVLKLFFEFIVAAVTAWFASSCVSWLG